MDGVVGAVEETLSPGLHRGVADQAEACEQRSRHERHRPPSSARTEQNDGDQRRRQNEMRRPDMAEGGAAEHRADECGIESGAPVVGHRGGLELKPRDRGQQRNEARDEREAAHSRRERNPQSLRGIGPEIGAHAERQHHGHEMGEAAKGERGHARAAARGFTSSCLPSPSSVRAPRRRFPSPGTRPGQSRHVRNRASL